MSNELTVYSKEDVQLIKDTVARGATDAELKLFLYACKRTGLDPLTRQIYFVKRSASQPGTIQTGIDGYRAIADRTDKYAGNDDPVFDNEESPQKASVTVYKLVGGEKCAFTSSARWKQYYPGDSQGFMWKKMPHLMLGKCAEALALRKAFPQDLSGIYTHEEMEQAGNSNTDSKLVLSERLVPKPYWDETDPEKKAALVGGNPIGKAPDGSWRVMVSPSEHPAKAKADHSPASTPPDELPFDESRIFWPGPIKNVTEHPGKKANGEEYVLYRIHMEDGRHATTFNAGLATDAGFMKGTEGIRVIVEDNKRRPGTFTYLGFEEMAQQEAVE